MKIFPLIVALGVLTVVASTTTAHAQETAPSQPVQEVKSETVLLKSVPARFMAWWLDPQNNERPIEVGGPQGQHGNSRGSGGGTFQLPSGVEAVSVADTGNALLIRGNQQGLAEIKATITFLDRPLRFFEFEMVTVKMKPKDAEAFFSDDKTLYGGAMRAGKGDIQGLLRTLRREHKAEVVKLAGSAAYNNSVARLVNYWEGKIVSSTDSTYTFYTTEILNVRPTIQYDGKVRLEVWMQSEVNDKTPTPSATLREVSHNIYSSEVEARDGETTALTPRIFNRRIQSKLPSKSVPTPEVEEIVTPVLVYLVTAHFAPIQEP